MEELNKSLQYLNNLNKIEQQKKMKHLKIKNIVINESENHGLLKKFLKEKSQYEYKNNLRLKSLRNKKQESVISQNFDEKYKEKQFNIFNKDWNKLNKQLKFNRIYRYLKKRQNELKWTQKEYEEHKENIRVKFKINKLKNLIEYDKETCEIKNCWLIDKKNN